MYSPPSIGSPAGNHIERKVESVWQQLHGLITDLQQGTPTSGGKATLVDSKSPRIQRADLTKKQANSSDIPLWSIQSLKVTETRGECVAASTHLLPVTNTAVDRPKAIQALKQMNMQLNSLQRGRGSSKAVTAATTSGTSASSQSMGTSNPSDKRDPSEGQDLQVTVVKNDCNSKRGAPSVINNSKPNSLPVSAAHRHSLRSTISKSDTNCQTRLQADHNQVAVKEQGAPQPRSQLKLTPHGAPSLAPARTIKQSSSESQEAHASLLGRDGVVARDAQDSYPRLSAFKSRTGTAQGSIAQHPARVSAPAPGNRGNMSMGGKQRSINFWVPGGGARNATPVVTGKGQVTSVGLKGFTKLSKGNRSTPTPIHDTHLQVPEEVVAEKLPETLPQLCDLPDSSSLQNTKAPIYLKSSENVTLLQAQQSDMDLIQGYSEIGQPLLSLSEDTSNDLLGMAEDCRRSRKGDGSSCSSGGERSNSSIANKNYMDVSCHEGHGLDHPLLIKDNKAWQAPGKAYQTTQGANTEHHALSASRMSILEAWTLPSVSTSRGRSSSLQGPDHVPPKDLKKSLPLSNPTINVNPFQAPTQFPTSFPQTIICQPDAWDSPALTAPANEFDMRAAAALLVDAFAAGIDVTPPLLQGLTSLSCGRFSPVNNCAWLMEAAEASHVPGQYKLTIQEQESSALAHQDLCDRVQEKHSESILDRFVEEQLHYDSVDLVSTSANRPHSVSLSIKDWLCNVIPSHSREDPLTHLADQHPLTIRAEKDQQRDQRLFNLSSSDNEERWFGFPVGHRPTTFQPAATQPRNTQPPLRSESTCLMHSGTGCSELSVGFQDALLNLEGDQQRMASCLGAWRLALTKKKTLVSKAKTVGIKATLQRVFFLWLSVCDDAWQRRELLCFALNRLWLRQFWNTWRECCSGQQNPLSPTKHNLAQAYDMFRLKCLVVKAMRLYVAGRQSKARLIATAKRHHKDRLLNTGFQVLIANVDEQHLSRSTEEMALVWHHARLATCVIREWWEIAYANPRLKAFSDARILLLVRECLREWHCLVMEISKVRLGTRKCTTGASSVGLRDKAETMADTHPETANKRGIGKVGSSGEPENSSFDHLRIGNAVAPSQAVTSCAFSDPSRIRKDKEPSGQPIFHRGNESALTAAREAVAAAILRASRALAHHACVESDSVQKALPQEEVGPLSLSMEPSKPSSSSMISESVSLSTSPALNLVGVEEDRLQDKTLPRIEEDPLQENTLRRATKCSKIQRSQTSPDLGTLQQQSIYDSGTWPEKSRTKLFHPYQDQARSQVSTQEASKNSDLPGDTSCMHKAVGGKSLLQFLESDVDWFYNALTPQGSPSDNRGLKDTHVSSRWSPVSNKKFSHPGIITSKAWEGRELPIQRPHSSGGFATSYVSHGFANFLTSSASKRLSNHNRDTAVASSSVNADSSLLGNHELKPSLPLHQHLGGHQIGGTAITFGPPSSVPHKEESHSCTTYSQVERLPHGHQIESMEGRGPLRVERLNSCYGSSRSSSVKGDDDSPSVSLKESPDHQSYTILPCSITKIQSAREHQRGYQNADRQALLTRQISEISEGLESSEGSPALDIKQVIEEGSLLDNVYKMTNAEGLWTENHVFESRHEGIRLLQSLEWRSQGALGQVDQGESPSELDDSEDCDGLSSPFYEQASSSAVNTHGRSNRLGNSNKSPHFPLHQRMEQQQAVAGRKSKNLAQIPPRSDEQYSTMQGKDWGGNENPLFESAAKEDLKPCIVPKHYRNGSNCMELGTASGLQSGPPSAQSLVQNKGTREGKVGLPLYAALQKILMEK